MYVSNELACSARRRVGCVDIFPLTGPSKGRIGSIANGINAPYGLSIDVNNALYVANEATCFPHCGNGTVTVYPYGSSSPSMTYSKGVQHPLYPLADSAGHVFVSGYSWPKHHRIRGYVFEYNAGTNVPIAQAQVGAVADGIAEDAKGDLYVAYRRPGSAHDGSIAEFGPRLTNERLLGMTIHEPAGLLVDRAGNIVVVESVGSDTIDVFPPGATQPSVRIAVPQGFPRQLAMQNSETTLWVSSEIPYSYRIAYIYSMPYPLTSSTRLTQYQHLHTNTQGIAVSPN